MVLETLGAEAAVMNEIRKVLASGYTETLIIHFSGSETDKFLIYENPTEATLKEVSRELAGCTNFVVRSDNLEIQGTQTLALHIIAS
jgi:ATP sulfurylase